LIYQETWIRGDDDEYIVSWVFVNNELHTDSHEPICQKQIIRVVRNVSG